jgi:hypothetical protein
MHEILSGRISPNATRRILRDGDNIVVRTDFDDDAALERNKQIREAGLINKAKLHLHDDEDIRFVISIPDGLQYRYFKMNYPDIYEMIKSKEEKVRMSGCKRLQILHPEWVVQERL